MQRKETAALPGEDIPAAEPLFLRNKTGGRPLCLCNRTPDADG